MNDGFYAHIGAASPFTIGYLRPCATSPQEGKKFGQDGLDKQAADEAE